MIVQRYFIGALLRGYLIVAAALLALFGLFAIMEEADDIGQAGYTASDALLFVLMSLPSTLLDLAPFVILLGTIFGLGGFLRSQELLALRTAGFSAHGIGGLALGAALIALAVLVPVEFAARPLLQQAILFRTSEQSPDGNLLDRDGSWIARDSTFVFVGSLVGGERPSRVSEFVFDENLELIRYRHAREAQILAPDRWRLRDVETSEIERDHQINRRVRALDWQPVWYPAPLLQEFPLASLSLIELGQHAGSQGDREGPTDGRGLEFWRRVLAPFAILAFAVLGASLVNVVRPRAGGGFVILIGLALAIGLYLFQQISTNSLARWGVPAILAVAIPSALVLALAYAAARRANEGPH